MDENSNLFGLFQRFRPHGEGVEQIFQSVPKGPAYLARLLPVYRATSDDACAGDMYFVVRSPASTTETELQEIGGQLLTELRGLATMIGNVELTKYVEQLSSIRIVPGSSLNRETDGNLLMNEVIGDWVRNISDRNDPIPELNEAFYSVACDFFLMYYLQWPYYERWYSRDVFQPYFELWRRGAVCGFNGETFMIALQGESGG